MKAICIKNTDYIWHEDTIYPLTIGKYYELIDGGSPFFYSVKNDSGVIALYKKDLFKVDYVIREEKLNELGI